MRSLGGNKYDIYGQCSYNNAQNTGSDRCSSKCDEFDGECRTRASEAGLSASRIIYDTREGLAKLFGAENARQIAFTSNSTESLNIAIKGILDPGDHVITTVLEHNSVLRPLYEMEKKGTELSVIGCNEKGMPDIAAMEAAIKENTKMIICTNGSNLTGNYVDVAVIGKMAHKHGLIFVVDASDSRSISN